MGVGILVLAHTLAMSLILYANCDAVVSVLLNAQDKVSLFVVGHT